MAKKKKVRILGVIPARYASTRFEGKPLAMILGKPMIYHVYKQAEKARILDDVIVATDDARIKECVEGFGGKVIMTSSSHQTGTDRIAEVAGRVNSDIIVNIQGDEPLLDPEMIEQVAKPLTDDGSVNVSTLMSLLSDNADFIDTSNVKVVVDVSGNVLFMSRSPIPYPKTRRDYKAFKQIGIYAFRRDYLIKFARMKQTPLELIEGVELLRAVESGHKVKGVLTGHRTFSVDTVSDLFEVTEIMRKTRQRGGGI